MLDGKPCQIPIPFTMEVLFGKSLRISKILITYQIFWLFRRHLGFRSLLISIIFLLLSNPNPTCRRKICRDSNIKCNLNCISSHLTSSHLTSSHLRSSHLRSSQYIIPVHHPIIDQSFLFSPNSSHRRSGSLQAFHNSSCKTSATIDMNLHELPRLLAHKHSFTTRKNIA